jgi:hypothetical protein
MSRAKRHLVEFEATKTVKKPTEVVFMTKDGTHVDFIAKKSMKENVDVVFMAKNAADGGR